ncbi:MAG: TetR/AcrR family transcriptional regulator [Pseudomonadota bacterium]
MQPDTRGQLLAAAKRQFAAKGFYGASISGVAGELGLSKQALLYHFKRKEDLYAEVLQEISERLLRFMRAAVSRADVPERQLEDILLGLYVSSRENPLDTQILVRELLDNQSRAETAKDWYLRPFLEELVAVARGIPGLEDRAFSAVFCIVYQVIGCIQYFAISSPTLTRMYDEQAFERIRDDFPVELRNQIRRLVASSGGA